MTTTTEEMEKKLVEENEQLKQRIKDIDAQKQPIEKQLKLNRKVLAVIQRQKSGNAPKRKYAKKKKAEAEADKL